MRSVRVNPTLFLVFFIVICLAAISFALRTALRNDIAPKKARGNLVHIGEHVTVMGKVVFVYVSTGGRPYTAFTLCNPACTLVFTHGHPHIQVGEWLNVSGTVEPYDGKGATQIVADNGSL